MRATDNTKYLRPICFKEPAVLAKYMDAYVILRYLFIILILGILLLELSGFKSSSGRFLANFKMCQILLKSSLVGDIHHKRSLVANLMTVRLSFFRRLVSLLWLNR